MRQGLAGVVALVEDVKLVRGALMGRVVRQDFHKALSLKGLRELCKYLILNRLRPHNKTEEEKNQEKKKKNPAGRAPGGGGKAAGHFFMHKKCPWGR